MMRHDLGVSKHASDLAMTTICLMMLVEPNVYGIDTSTKLMNFIDDLITTHVATKDEDGELNDPLLFDVTKSSHRYTFIDSTGMPRVYNKEAVRKLGSNALPSTENSDHPIFFPKSVKTLKKSPKKSLSPMAMYANIRTQRQQHRRRGLAPAMDDDQYGLPTSMTRLRMHD